MNEQEPDEVVDLLAAERELTAEEQGRLTRYSQAGWRSLQTRLGRQAKQAYAVANREEFAECVFEHLTPMDKATLVTSDVYHCPSCGRLLKDRKTPVASAVLQERNRVRDLWLEVERAEPQERDAAIARFRRAVGLPT